MRFRPHLLAAACLAMLPHLSADAALLLRPGGMVYDSDTDLTWLVNWNAAAGSSFDDGPSATDGRLSWAQASAWADALSWGGAEDWRLPASDLCFGFGCQGSEMGRLWYVALGQTAGQQPTSTAPFTNLMFAPYWSGSTLPGAPGQAWYFNALGGSQNLLPVSAQAHAVAVHAGDVASMVPEPGTGWMALAGLAVAAGLTRRRTRPVLA